MRLGKRDIVPTEVNLRPQYRSFGELEAACRAFCDEVNARVHRVTGRAPAEMLTEEHARLHRLPAAADLVHMLTAGAAHIAGLADGLGVLAPGRPAG